MGFQICRSFWHIPPDRGAISGTLAIELYNIGLPGHLPCRWNFSGLIRLAIQILSVRSLFLPVQHFFGTF